LLNNASVTGSGFSIITADDLADAAAKVVKAAASQSNASQAKATLFEASQSKGNH